LHAPKVFFHFSDIMNIHPCLDKYLFLPIAQVHMNKRFGKYQVLHCTKIHPVGVKPLHVGGWGEGERGRGREERQRETDRKPAVPFTNGLTNVLYATNTIYPQKVTSCSATTSTRSP
jgi:hypothetical protein